MKKIIFLFLFYITYYLSFGQIKNKDLDDVISLSNTTLQSKDTIMSLLHLNPDDSISNKGIVVYSLGGYLDTILNEVIKEDKKCNYYKDDISGFAIYLHLNSKMNYQIYLTPVYINSIYNLGCFGLSYYKKHFIILYGDSNTDLVIKSTTNLNVGYYTKKMNAFEFNEFGDYDGTLCNICVGQDCYRCLIKTCIQKYAPHFKK